MHCPLCRYDLTGLPVTYRCPECGFEYDPAEIVYELQPYSRWEHVVESVLFAALLLGGGRLAPRRLMIVLWLAAGAGLLFTTVRAIVHRNRRGGVLVINRNGVFFHYDGQETHRFAWDAIGSASRGWVAGCMVLRDTQDRVLHRCGAQYFKKTRRVIRCVHDLNRLAAAYRSGRLAEALCDVNPVEP